MSGLGPYNPYGYDDANFDIRDVLPVKLREYYDRSFKYIAKYDTEQDWVRNLNLKHVHKKIRISLWREIQRLVKYDKKNFSIKAALEGYQHPANFYKMAKKPELCAYFFTRPMDLNLESRLLLDDSIQNIRNIMDLNVLTAKGNVRPSVIAAQLKIHQMLENRVMGQSVQRIEQHTLSEKLPEKKTIAQIEMELKALEKKGGSSPEVFEADLIDESPDSQIEE